MKQYCERILFILIGIFIVYFAGFVLNNTDAQDKKQLEPLEKLLFNLDMIASINHLDSQIIGCKIEILDNYVKYKLTDDANERRKYIDLGFEYDKKLIYLSAAHKSLTRDHEPITLTNDLIKSVSETLEREFNERIKTSKPKIRKPTELED